MNGNFVRRQEDEDGRLSVQTVMQAVREAQEIIRRTTRQGEGSAVDELLRERRGRSSWNSASSSALLAVLFHEPGADVVIPVLNGSLISSVNAAEVLRVVQRRGTGPADAQEALRRFPVHIRPFDHDDAIAASEIGHSAPHLSLGDCACIALARRESAGQVLTAGRIWAGIKLGVKVKLIR